jgi:signal transduction histidine kinase
MRRYGYVWPIALLLLVGLLATLQYQWLGQVSAAERAQMQTSLRAHADEFVQDFDREVLLAYIALQAEGPALGAGDWKAFADHYEARRASARYPQLVRDIYFLHEPDRQLMRFDAEARTFHPAEWPAELASLRDRLTAARAADTGALHLLTRMGDPIDSTIPALVVTLPVVQTLETSGVTIDMEMKRSVERAAASLQTFQISGGVVIATLDRAYIQNTMLPELAARYFPAPVDQTPGGLLAHADGYRLAVVFAGDDAHPIYARGLAPNASINSKQADADVALLTLRYDLADQIMTRDNRAVYAFSARGTSMGPAPFTAAAPPVIQGDRAGKLSIVVQSTGSPGAELALTKTRLAATQSGWHLVLQHSAGSLDAAVTQARRRSLTMSFGVLALLAISVGLIAINAQRSQRLAAQQMDFVATVSHELRTPLAVIRSAAQNLSAGVIHDAAQAKRYGELIDTEGKRLTDMVEQVLEFAGLDGNRRPLATHPIDAPALVKDVLESCAALLQFEHFQVDVQTGDVVPLVAADEGALRRALHNLVTNAIKYGAEGRWIGVSITSAPARGATEVQIAVSDHGQGIDAEDLPHLFEPFYRGRSATERQIHGSGLGLSLVKRIADAHGGRITVRSVPGEGSTFTLHLPAAKADTVMGTLEGAQTRHA